MSNDNQFMQQRREKAEALAELGVNLYSNTFTPANTVSELLPYADNLEAEQAEESGKVFSVAGRIMAMRKFGKAAFCQLTDSSGKIQIYFKKQTLGDEISFYKIGLELIFSGTPGDSGLGLVSEGSAVVERGEACGQDVGLR